jgi:hypothetical protein
MEYSEESMLHDSSWKFLQDARFKNIKIFAWHYSFTPLL